MKEYDQYMAQFHLQIKLPDRPGSLGTVASAIGFAGGDIRNHSVVKNEDGEGVDDLVVAIPGTDPTDLLNVLNAIGGVQVISVEKV
jgi:hypothetical protein